MYYICREPLASFIMVLDYLFPIPQKRIMTNRISLLSAFLLLLTAVIGCNKIADFVGQVLDEEARQARLSDELGDESIKRFEQMFRTEKFDFDYRGDKGGNILHYAVMLENLDRVKILVEKGADVNATDNHGQTPLHQAVEGVHYSDDKSGNMEIVKYLVEHGADVNAKSNLEDTVLHRASAWGNLELIKYLVEHGADVNEKDWKQETPLYKAVQAHTENQLDLVQFLVEHGADINAKAPFGETTLHFAVKGRNLELVEWLVEQGLDVNAKDDSGKTVLQYAKEYWNQEIIEYLKEHGAEESEQ